MTININTSCAKSFFKSVDIRSDPEAIEKFKTILVANGLAIAKNAAENARSRNRKTVSPQDFDENVKEGGNMEQAQQEQERPDDSDLEEEPEEDEEETEEADEDKD